MKVELARALLERNVIRKETEVTARYRAPYIGGIDYAHLVGNFLIQRAVKAADRVLFDVTDLEQGRQHRIPCEDVLRIDGMDLKRLSKIYNLTEDGTPTKPSKRRGRRPKNWVEPTEPVVSSFSTVFDTDVDDDEDEDDLLEAA